jgi:hypothetical protein
MSESLRLIAAREYRARGWYCVPVVHGRKRPIGNAWQEERYDGPALEAAFRGIGNLGVLVGAPSGIVDVDIDCEDALALADAHLPPTPTVFGRAGKPRSHRIYKVAGACKTRQFKIADKVRRKSTTIVELRGDGGQTVFPPSVHPSGERVTWATPEAESLEPTEIEYDVLLRAVHALANAVRVKLGFPEEPLPENQPEVEQAADEDALVEPPAVTRLSGTLADGSEHGLVRVTSALDAIELWRVDDYDSWVRVGMSLHAIDVSLLPAWEEWSRRSPKYRDGDCERRWKRFKANAGVGPGSLFYLARQGGWRPPEDLLVVSNFREVETEDGVIKAPLPMEQIIAAVKTSSGDWPRRVGSNLFVDECGAVSWLQTPASAFGFVGSRTGRPPRFVATAGVHSKEEVFCELRRSAISYRGIEVLPHEPLIEGHYYACSIPMPGDGKTLQSLLDRFSPESDADAALVKLLIATAFWGGPAGSRPAWLITAAAGRGAGKSTLGSVVSRIAGGHLDVSANEDIAVIKQRALSPEGLTRRILFLDNIKSSRLSWAEMESLITSKTISGRALYIGEASRENNLNVILTLNGASLSTDMSQRCVIVRLKKAKYSPTWEEDTFRFVDENRDAIIADIIGFLRGPKATMTKSSRWGQWEKDVLALLPDPDVIQSVIVERQGEVDVEADEAEIVEDYFRGEIGALLVPHGLDPSTSRIFIPSKSAATWVGNALGDKCTTTGGSRLLRQLIGERRFQCLADCPSRSHGRGFLWIGEESDAGSPVRHMLSPSAVAVE